MALPRFTVRTMMSLVAANALVLGFLANYHAKLGCGRSSVSLDFQVVDSLDGTPVVGAKVELIDYDMAPMVCGFTENDGSFRTTCKVGSTTYDGPFFQRYHSYHYCFLLRVGAEKYCATEGMIEDYMKDKVYYNDKKAHPPILIKLQRKSGISSASGSFEVGSTVSQTSPVKAPSLQ